MKTSSPKVYGWVFQVSHQVFGRFAILPLLLLFAAQIFGQAPSLVWSTNIGATLFAIDANTNVYANVGGTVIKLSGDGVPLQTNAICPRSGIAIRDSSANYYFAGLMPSHAIVQNMYFDPQDFGGVVLSNMPVYLAKYSSAGTLLWATNIGPVTVLGIGLQDFVIDDEGDLVVSFGYSLGSSSRFQTTAKFGSSGSQMWESTTFVPLGSSITGVGLSLYSYTNVYSLT